MRNLLFIGLICGLFVGSVFAQKSGPWNEWSKKDVDKILNDSAWGQTQIKGEKPADTSASLNAGRSQQPTSSPAGVTLSPEIYFRVRFITAKPIREAFARRRLLAEPKPTKELTDQLQAAIDREFGDLIVVAVNAEGQDPRIIGGTLQAFGRMTTEALKEKAYLERKDGKRSALIEYRPPTADGLGGKFVFSRNLDGKPFISADSDSIRFVLDQPGNLKLNVKFKVANMMYGGSLEY